MATTSRVCFAGLLGTTLVLATPASADDSKAERSPKTVQKDHDPDPDRRDVGDAYVTVAPMLGFGTNGLGAGVGVRVGYTLRTRIYLGAHCMYHAGDGSSRSAYYPSAEVGYDLGVGRVVIRPYGGVGAIFRDRGGSTSSAAVIHPGLTLHYRIPRSPGVVGADARLLVPTDGMAAVALAGTAGLDF